MKDNYTKFSEINNFINLIDTPGQLLIHTINKN